MDRKTIIQKFILQIRWTILVTRGRSPMVCRGSIRYYAEFKFQTFEQAILKLVFKSMTNPIRLRDI